MAVRSLEATFQNGWRANGTDSGPGSTLANTKRLRSTFTEIIELVGNGSGTVRINDVGCGDLAWMRTMLTTKIDYVGYDVVKWPTWDELREQGVDLVQRDVIADDMRDADLVICRDVMIHLPNEMIQTLLSRCRARTKYLLATTYAEASSANYEREKVLPRPLKRHARLDLRLAPFNLGEPVMMMPENQPNKLIGLWRLS